MQDNVKRIMDYARRRYLSLALLLLSPLCLGAGSQALPAGVDPVTGFRLERYRAPVPQTLPGGQVLSPEASLQAHRSGQWLFIDVYPPKGLGPDPLDGNWISNEEHLNIPGSTWLPEVGRGYLASDAEAYFRRNLEKLTRGSLSRRMVFYCTADCWQSWNAARRAILWGYTDVYWFPEGTDGWLDLGQTLQPATPVNFME